MTVSTLPPSITTELTALATNGKLQNHDNFRGPYPKNGAEIWLPGKLFQAILSTTNKTTPLLALGQTPTQLIALALDPTSPEVIALSPTQAFTPIEVAKPPLAGNNSVKSTITHTPPPFLKTGHTKTTMPPVVPLRQNFLATYLAEDTLLHPATLHTELTKDVDVKNSHATPLWLQAACAATESIMESALAITPQPLTLPLPPDVSATMATDLEELLTPDHEPLLDALKTANIINKEPQTNTEVTATASTPKTSNHHTHTTNSGPHDRLRTQDLFIAKPPQVNEHQQPFPQPQTFPHSHPQGYSATESYYATAPPHRPTNYRTEFPPATYTRQPLGYPATAAASPWVTPPPNARPTHYNRAGTPRHDIRSMHDKATQRINEILNKPDELSMEDVHRMNAYAAIQNFRKPSYNSDKPNNANAQRIFHFLGWSGHHSITQFHQATNYIWEEILAETTIANREAKITNLIVHPLRSLHPKLRRILHPEWIKTIATFDFAPQPFAFGNKAGIGPMAFVTRTTKELQAVQNQRDMVAEASIVNTHDIRKTKLGAPIMPSSLWQVTDVLTDQCLVLRFLFTNACPLAHELTAVIEALHDSSDLLSELPNFQWKVAAELLWQVTHETQRFFEHTALERDLAIGNRPRTDLQWLANNVRRGFFQPAHNKPILFTEPQQGKRNNDQKDLPNKRPRDVKASNDPKTPLQVLTKTLSPKCSAIVKAYREDNPRRHFPLLATVRSTLSISTDKELASHLGIPEGACIRYNLYGECRSRNCTRKHDQTTKTNDKHPGLLAKLLSKAQLPTPRTPKSQLRPPTQSLSKHTSPTKSPPKSKQRISSPGVSPTAIHIKPRKVTFATTTLTDPQRKYHSVARGLMYPRGPITQHPAYPLLLHYATTGCPVDCGRDWTRRELQAAVTRGSHPSAKDPAAAAACRKEALERVNDGCCNVIRWSQLQKACPPNLKVSPIAAIPHKSRAFRMILDLSFSLRTLSSPIPAVNDASNKSLAPHHAMYELGNVIPRLVHTMATTKDHTTPFMYMKVDLKDGYWRMVVNPGDAYNFAYVLPPAQPTNDPELVIPESLQMGWSESPAFFCAATETARDEAHRTAFLPLHFPAHRMEDIIMAIDWTKMPATFQPPTNPLTIIEVYLDDFIIMTQSTQEAYLRHLTRCLLYAIESVFPGPEITGSAMGPAISTKKLQEEGTWDTLKEILGWEFDGLKSTITLPPAKATKILKSIHDICHKHWLPLKDFQKVHGRLQHTAIVIPCGKPLMGPLDAAIATTIRLGNPNVKLTTYVKSVLKDWITLIHQAAARPTHVKELIPHKPSFHGFVDASGWGVGGVWFSGTQDMAPTVWFLRWPTDITDNLATDTNPSGSISISDLELAGIILHFLALEALLAPTQQTLRHATVAIWCDNLAAVAWAHKNRTSTSPVAIRLLRVLALRLRHNAAALPNIQHISGVFNVMADMASRKHKRLLDFVPLQHRHNIETLFRATSQAVAAGVVAATTKTRRRLWNAWAHWLHEFYPQVSTDLSSLQHDTAAQQQLLGSYAQYVRQGRVFNGELKVRAQTVQLALSAISQTLLLDGQQSPLETTKGGFPKAIRQQLEGYRRADPPPEPRLAVPLSVPRFLVTMGRASDHIKTQTIGDMCLIAFFFLLRVGEYTYTRANTKKRTRPFTIDDVTFWHHTRLLPQTLSTHDLLTQATAATMSIKNQKSGEKYQPVHVDALRTDLCPIRALIRRVKHIRTHSTDRTLNISTYFITPRAAPRALDAQDINKAIKHAVTALDLRQHGLAASDVSSHSLRAGGAMAMYLNDVPAITIRKLGRWKSDAFLFYLHEQIAAFSSGVAEKMSNPIFFRNVLQNNH